MVIDNETYYWKIGCSSCANCLCVTMPDKNKVIRLAPEAVLEATGYETWLLATSPGRVRFVIDRMIISPKKKELGLPRNKTPKHKDDPVIGKMYTFRETVMTDVDRANFSDSLVPYWEDQTSNIRQQMFLLAGITWSSTNRVYRHYHYCTMNGKVGHIGMLANVKWKNLFKRVV